MCDVQLEQLEQLAQLSCIAGGAKHRGCGVVDCGTDKNRMVFVFLGLSILQNPILALSQFSLGPSLGPVICTPLPPLLVVADEARAACY